MTTKVTLRIALGLLLGALTGCGESGPELGEVQGTVRMGGRPLVGVLVSFLPEVADGNYGRRSSGMTDENGRYQLTCDDVKNPRPGAAVGWHLIVVNDPEMENLDNPARFRRPQIPLHYQAAIQTPLRREVKFRDPQTIDIDITN
jgi:hypothetical protein